MTVATVKAVEAKTTQSGKPYWRVNLGGVGWSSTFSSTIGKFTTDSVGQDIEVETKKDGNFTNIVSAKAIRATGESGGTPSRDLLIVKEVALKAAVERFAGNASASDEDIISTAQVFTDWLVGEPEPPEPFDPDEIPS